MAIIGKSIRNARSSPTNQKIVAYGPLYASRICTGFRHTNGPMDQWTKTTTMAVDCTGRGGAGSQYTPLNGKEGKNCGGLFRVSIKLLHGMKRSKIELKFWNDELSMTNSITPSLPIYRPTKDNRTSVGLP